MLNIIPQDDTPLKRCPHCPKGQEWHPATTEFFSRRSAAKDGLQTYCKQCAIEKLNERYHAPAKPFIPDGHKYCPACNKVFPATTDYFHSNRHMKDGLRNECKLCRAKKRSPDRQNTELYQPYDLVSYDPQNLRVSNKELMKARCLQFAKEHRPIGRVYSQRRRALKKAAKGSYTPEQVEEMYKRQKGKCYYCGLPTGRPYHVDHVVPLSRSGSNDISNLVIACRICNCRKSDRLPHEWPEGGKLM